MWHRIEDVVGIIIPIRMILRLAEGLDADGEIQAEDPEALTHKLVRHLVDPILRI